MKDPEVQALVSQFLKEVEALNKTWNKLQANDVYVRMEMKGSTSYTEPKYIDVVDFAQTVKYLKD